MLVLVLVLVLVAGVTQELGKCDSFGSINNYYNQSLLFPISNYNIAFSIGFLNHYNRIVISIDKDQSTAN